MNQAERKFFLKRFFSFNTTNSSLNSSSPNGSINELKLTILPDLSPPPAILIDELDQTESDQLLTSCSSTTPLMNTNHFFNNTSSLLQQQSSIELKPFRKKEVLISEDNSGFNSFKTDITYLDWQTTTSSFNNQEQLKLYQQTFRSGFYNKLRYKFV